MRVQIYLDELYLEPEGTGDERLLRELVERYDVRGMGRDPDTEAITHVRLKVWRV